MILRKVPLEISLTMKNFGHSLRVQSQCISAQDPLLLYIKLLQTADLDACSSPCIDVDQRWYRLENRPYVAESFLAAVDWIYLQYLHIYICCTSNTDRTFTFPTSSHNSSLSPIFVLLFGRIYLSKPTSWNNCKIYSWEPPFTPPNPANFFFQSK